MQRVFSTYSFFIAVFLLLQSSLTAETGRYRAMWREDPSTTMVVGWDQISGNSAKLYFDVVNHGQSPNKYAFSKVPSETVVAKGMNNHFVRLAGLRANTKYYFLIVDNEGISESMFFVTAPNQNTTRLSVIAGSDSRNNRSVRIDANKMVSKLRAHCVIFGGDFTDNDDDTEWQAWFDDWQHTISKDGRLTPILVARGNHEANNQTLVDLFDVMNKKITYALSLGGDLLRVYTLNTMIAVSGDQRTWLQRDLAANPHVSWKIAQYHQSIKPHTSRKTDKNEQLFNWAPLFYEYGVQLVVESDAHVVKSTYPIRPSRGPENEQGFVRDDEAGTVYVGEGSWGAPLRQADDNKTWTRASGSFNAFHWIFIDKDQMEVRFVKTDGADAVADINPNNIFEMPHGINIWAPPTGEVILIQKEQEQIFALADTSEPLAFADRGNSIPQPEVEVGFQIIDFSAIRKQDDIVIKWTTEKEPDNLVYELQRSIDGWENYDVLSTIEGKGDVVNEYLYVDYSFASKNPSKFVNYRLRQVKEDGEDAYTSINKRAKKKAALRAKQKPINSDPATNTITVLYHLKERGNVIARLINIKERVVRKWEIPNQQQGKSLKTLDVKGIPRGRYIMILTSRGRPISKVPVRIL